MPTIARPNAPAAHLAHAARGLYRRYREAGYPLLPVTRLVREPLRWIYHRSPLLRHDSRPYVKPRLLTLLHEALVRDHPHDFTLYRGRLKFRSYGSLMSVQGYYVGEIEYHLLRFLLSQIRDGLIMVDVGAHHGVFTTVAAYELQRRGFNGVIHSFEPHPENFALLQHNVRQNGIERYTRLYNAAVAAVSGQGLLITDPGENSDNALATLPGDKGEQVAVLALDQILSENERVGLIKIDVQGGEPTVLAGAAEIIARNRPTIIVEAVQGWPSTEETRAFLLSHDYRIFGVDRYGRLCPPDSPRAFVSWDWVGVPQ
jgi:FkbM family methyltransferase